MRRVLLVAIGQSNWQGAAMNECGALPARYRSRYTGITDPLPGCNNINQGGSCFPQLIDLAAERGVKLDVVNFAIGGASITHFTGTVGAAIAGGAATLPAQQGYMSPVSLTGGAGAAVESGINFDPFGLLARARAEITARGVVNYDRVVSYWVNGESDAGTGAATYGSYLMSVANYMLGSGVDRHIIGMTSKQAAATDAQFIALQQGVTQAVETLRSQGKAVSAGHDMFAAYGASPPLYPESNGAYVHMTLRGQEMQARLVDAVLSSFGY